MRKRIFTFIISVAPRVPCGSTGLSLPPKRQGKTACLLTLFYLLANQILPNLET